MGRAIFFGSRVRFGDCINGNLRMVGKWGWLCVWMWLELEADVSSEEQVDRGGQCGCGASSWAGKRTNVGMGLDQTENRLEGKGVQVGVRAGWRLEVFEGELRKLLLADQQVLVLVKGYFRRGVCRERSNILTGVAGIWEAYLLEL